MSARCSFPRLSYQASTKVNNIPGPSRLRCLTQPILAHSHIHRDFSTSGLRCSGHNRWSKIRHKKGAADMEKSKVNSRLVQELYASLRPPNSMDPLINSRLAGAIQKARDGGVTKAAIEGVFEKAKNVHNGTGQSTVIEALGPGGKEAFMIQCMTDNRNRTLQTIRGVLSKHHCAITPVSFLFEKKGIISIIPPVSEPPALPPKGFDQLFELAVDGGAEDVKEIEGEEGPEWEIFTQPNDLGSLTNLLSAPEHSSDFPIHSSELGYIPIDPIEIGDDAMGVSEDKAEMVMRVVELLEEEPDVVNVWTNLA